MRISLICIGNELLLDDGVGPAVARYLLSRYRFPDNVAVIDRACMGMAIISDLREADFALVLDAVEVPGATPGEIFSFEPTDVAPTPAGMTSLHDVRFADVLGSARFLGISCTGHCFGVQVENMSPSEFVRALTPKVAAAVPLLARTAVRYLRDELGIEVEDLLEQGTASVVLPQVHGTPDASVMTGYLAHGLMDAGFAVSPVDGKSNEMVLAIETDSDLSRLTARDNRSGRIETVPAVGDSGWLVRVSNEANDLDCDAFVRDAVDACGKKR